MFKQTWKILLDKCSKTFMQMIESFLFFLLPVLFIYLVLGQFNDLFG